MAQVPRTPLFVKTHDFVVWLFQHTARFPKRLRWSYTQRLENSVLELECTLLRANAARGEARSRLLEEADGELLALRGLLRYAVDFGLLGGRQSHFAAQCVDELGRLLGAWQKGAGC